MDSWTCRVELVDSDKKKKFCPSDLVDSDFYTNDPAISELST